MSRVVPLLAWLSLLIAQFFLAPEVRPDVGPWVMDLLMGRWEGHEPFSIAEFQTMGIWPALLACQLAAYFRAKPLPAWPFLIGSCFLGCFILPLWFFGPAFHSQTQPPGAISKFFRRAGLPAVLGLGAAALWAWAITNGSWSTFTDTFRNEGFIFVMTIDFIAFWALSAALAHANRDQSALPWWTTLVPVFGTCAWLVRRKPSHA